MKIISANITGSLIINGLDVESSITGSQANIDSLNSETGSYAVTGSNSFNGNQSITGSLTITETITGSISNAISASYASNADLLDGRDGSTYANTGSNAFVGQQNINGSVAVTGSLTTTGTIVAQTLNVQQVTSSIVYSSGSNIFGNNISNTQSMTGSVGISGSLSVNGVSTLSGALTGTSGTFSGVLTSGTSTVGNINAKSFLITTDGTETNYRWQAYLGGSDSYTIYSRNFGDVLSLNYTTGAATFSSNVETQSRLIIQTATSPTAQGQIGYGGDAGLYIWPKAGATYAYTLYSNTGNEVMRIPVNTTNAIFSGNVGIGTASPTQALSIGDGTSTKYIRVQGSISDSYFGSDSNGTFLGNDSNAALYINTNSVERMRITSGGNVLIGTTTDNGAKLQVSGNGRFDGSTAGPTLDVRNNNNTSGDNALTSRLGGNADNTSSYLFVGETGGVNKVFIYGNGNIVNTNNSYGTLSDILLKENIVYATPKLNDILNLKVRNFNLISDTNKLKQIGFIAQEFEEVFPSLVDFDAQSGLKTIKTSVLIPILIKSIQELTARIIQLENN